MIIQKFYRICKEKKLRAIQKHHGKMPSSVEIKLSSVRRSRSLNLNSSDNLEKSKLSKFHRVFVIFYHVILLLAGGILRVGCFV